MGSWSLEEDCIRNFICNVTSQTHIISYSHTSSIEFCVRSLLRRGSYSVISTSSEPIPWWTLYTNNTRKYVGYDLVSEVCDCLRILKCCTNWFSNIYIYIYILFVIWLAEQMLLKKKTCGHFTNTTEPSNRTHAIESIIAIQHLLLQDIQIYI